MLSLLEPVGTEGLSRGILPTPLRRPPVERRMCQVATPLRVLPAVTRGKPHSTTHWLAGSLVVDLQPSHGDMSIGFVGQQRTLQLSAGALSLEFRLFFCLSFRELQPSRKLGK